MKKTNLKFADEMSVNSENQRTEVLFTSLNPQQLEAVQTVDGPLLVFAGAGSGKTRVLTHRFAHIVINYQVPSEQVLAVTFTNKAAGEMKQRIANILGYRAALPWVSTFHSAGVKILRRFAREMGFTSQFAIYDSDDSLTVLKRIIKQLKLDPRLLDARSARGKIDRAKNSYRFPDYYQELGGRRRDENLLAFAEVYTRYQTELAACNAMDFGDLLCNVVSLFKLENRILRSFQQQFSYIMVDEYQDTNTVQYMLIKMLSAAHQNICVVGDDDQSIYRFRGATIENILRFKKDFPTARSVILHTNYRSTKTILSAAQQVIEKNSNRQDKQLRTDNPVGQPIGLFRAFDENDEARFISHEIALLRAQGVSANEIAIFYRVNAQSRALEEAMVREGIPYRIFGGQRFYDRKEIKDMLAYFRLCLNRDDNESFLRIVNVPTRGIGATSVAGLQSFALEQRLSLSRALELALTSDNIPFINKANRKRFLAFCSLVNNLSVEAGRLGEVLVAREDVSAMRQALPALLRAIAFQSDYLPKLQQLDTPEADARVENIFELINVAEEFAIRAVEQPNGYVLSDFLDRAALVSDLDAENTSSSVDAREQSAVNLMTLHLAKGLEFDHVFLTGVEDGLIPHQRSLSIKEELEEERRLFYVGITRAKKRLVLSRAAERRHFGQSYAGVGLPSQFLYDVDASLIEDLRI